MHQTCIGGKWENENLDLSGILIDFLHKVSRRVRVDNLRIFMSRFCRVSDLVLRLRKICKCIGQDAQQNGCSARVNPLSDTLFLGES
jgi:hypothetical protein